MLIGQNIKKLRKSADMTQEELAEMLSISSQAVSRWETDSAMPDISILPSLCGIFNVSADELLGIDVMNRDVEINEIRQSARDKSSRGRAEEAREILEDGLRKFPKSYLLMRDLMYVAYKQSTNGIYSQDQRKLFGEEAIRWGERILTSCTDDEARNAAIQVQSFAYSDMGNTEKAKALASRMPHMAVCQQALMSRIAVGDERFQAKQTELHLCTQFLSTGITRMNTKMDNGEWRYSAEEVSRLNDKSIELLCVMFEDGNFGFYHTRLSAIHSDQAEYHAKLKATAKTLYHLEKAAEHAIAFLDWVEGGEYTCLIFKGMERGRFSSNSTRNDALDLIERMDSEVFAFLSDNEKFIGIRDRLKPLAHHW